MRLQERLPRRALVPLGSRGEPVVVQDPLDRVPGDVVAEVGERAADPRVAPRRILPRHPHDEFGHRPGRHRPSPTSAGTAIVLLGDQPPVPAENRVGRDDACHLTQDPPAEFLASHRESPALGVGQAKRSRTKVLPEDAILLPEIVDAIFLVVIHPASQGQHKEVQSVGHGLRLHGSDTAVTHVVSGIHSPRPFSRTIRGITFLPTSGSRAGGMMKEKTARITDAMTDLQLGIDGLRTPYGATKRPRLVWLLAGRPLMARVASPPVAGVRRPACRPALASADEDPVDWPRRLAPHRRVVGCVRRCRNLVSIPGRSAASAVQADIGHHPRRARPVPATGAPRGGVGGFVRRCGGCVAAAAGSRAVGRRWAWR